MDTVAPTPSLTVTPSTAGSFNLTWSASDPATVPGQANPSVQEFDLQVGQAVTSTIAWQGWLTATNQTSADYSGKVGYSYYFRVKARDRAGNQNAAWVQAGPYSISRLATKYYLFGSQRVAMRQGNVVYYLHSDHLGSTSLTTDASGAVVSQARYLPYGETRWGGAGPTDFGFTGQRNDSFGLMDYNARFYSPFLGRFISPDSIVPNPGNPQDLNRYSYVRNNPIRYKDPSGHCPDACIVLIVVLVVAYLALPDIAYAPDDEMASHPLPPSDLPFNDMAAADLAAALSYGLLNPRSFRTNVPTDEEIGINAASRRNGFRPGFTDSESQYIDDALNGDMRNIQNETVCFDAARCLDTITPVGDDLLDANISGKFTSKLDDSVFNLAGELGDTIQPNQLQPGDFALYYDNEGTLIHANRVLEVKDGMPVFFDKSGGGSFTQKTLTEVMGQADFDKVFIFRR